MLEVEAFAKTAEPGSIPHVVIVDECGCRRAVAAAKILEAWLEKAGVCVVWDPGCSKFWWSFVACEVEKRRLARKSGEVRPCPVCDPSMGHLSAFLQECMSA